MIGWEKAAMKMVAASCLTCHSWMLDQLQLARFAHVPVGNIEADPVMFLSDLLMARKLRENNCLLWYSTTGKPDLGGKELDDYRHASPWRASTEGGWGRQSAHPLVRASSSLAVRVRSIH